MAFFRTVSLSDLMPAVSGEGVVLRAPQMSDHAEWAALREASRDFLTPWEPAWPADDLARSSFRRRIKRYSEDQRGDLAYAFFVFRKIDDVLVGGLTLAEGRIQHSSRGCHAKPRGEARYAFIQQGDDQGRRAGGADVRAGAGRGRPGSG